MFSGFERWAAMVLGAGLLGGCATFPPLASDAPQYHQKLAGPSWNIKGFWDQDVTGTPGPTILFDGTSVKGFSGCNDFEARYTMKGPFIQITHIEKESDRVCTSDLAAQEIRLLDALDLVRKVDLVSVDAMSLRMRHGVPIRLQRQQ